MSAPKYAEPLGEHNELWDFKDRSGKHRKCKAPKVKCSCGFRGNANDLLGVDPDENQTLWCPQCETALALLKQKPEAGEFTKEIRKWVKDSHYCDTDVSLPDFVHLGTRLLEACDRLDAANGAALYYQEVNQVLIEKQTQLEAENKAKDEEIERLKKEIKALQEELMEQAEQFHSKQYCKCNWCQMVKEQALKEKQ